jgi:hypothetical protein
VREGDFVSSGGSKDRFSRILEREKLEESFAKTPEEARRMARGDQTGHGLPKVYPHQALPFYALRPFQVRPVHMAGGLQPFSTFLATPRHAPMARGRHEAAERQKINRRTSGKNQEQRKEDQ